MDGTIGDGPAARPRILVGTTSAHKVAELSAILHDLGCDLASPVDAGLADFDVDETGDTMMANAILKATAFADASGMPALADDSGLEVDALGGEPGVRSRRFAGDGATDADRIDLVLARLAGVPGARRTARFRSVLAFAVPGDLVGTGTGTVEGTIDLAPHGSNGFGYDPVFLVGGRRPSMGELSPGEKNAVSHRSRAAAAIRPVIEAWLARLRLPPSPAGAGEGLEVGDVPRATTLPPSPAGAGEGQGVGAAGVEGQKGLRGMTPLSRRNGGGAGGGGSFSPLPPAGDRCRTPGP